MQKDLYADKLFSIFIGLNVKNLNKRETKHFNNLKKYVNPYLRL